MIGLILLAVLYDAALVVACLFAWVRGGRPERFGATICFVASMTTVALRWMRIASGAPAELLVLSIDVAVAASFYWLAVRTDRFWPLWAFGFGLADILVSIAGAILPTAPFVAYHTGLGIYAYLALAALTVGTLRLPKNAPPEQRRGSRPRWQAPTRS